MTFRLVLFDIDQTLIHGAGCGRRALEKALEEILRVKEGLKDISTSGKTDTYIVFEALEKNGMLQSLSPKKDFLLWERYIVHLQNELNASTEARIQEGVVELLEQLQNESDTCLGLLTGNIENGAKAKLEHFGLWNYFAAGGFGSDHLDRNIVAQVALDRCRAHFNRPFPVDQVVVVGDSVRDIAAARAIGAKAVMVATGLDTYATLLSEQPYSLFHNFINTDAVLKALQGDPHFDPELRLDCTISVNADAR